MKYLMNYCTVKDRCASWRAQALVEDIFNHVKFKFGDKDASGIFMEGRPRKEVAWFGDNMHQPNRLVNGPSKARTGQGRDYE